MEIHFDKEYLQQLYEEGKTKDKKYRFQPQMGFVERFPSSASMRSKKERFYPIMMWTQFLTTNY